MPTQFRRDTDANWRANNPVLAVAEPAYNTTTRQFKLGDGASTYINLPSVNTADSVFPAGGRLTLFSNLPVYPETWQTSGSIIYYAPYVSDKISLWSGTSWQIYTFSTSTALNIAGLPANKCFDVFAYQVNGVVTLTATQWTNNVNRQVDITYVNGVLVKSGNVAQRYLGTFRTSALGTTTMSFAKKLIYNQYNKIAANLLVSYSTPHTYLNNWWRPWNNTIDDNSLAEFIVGQPTNILVGHNSYFKAAAVGPFLQNGKPITITLAAPAALGATSLTLSSSASDDLFATCMITAPFLLGYGVFINSLSGNVAQISSPTTAAAAAGDPINVCGQQAPIYAFAGSYNTNNFWISQSLFGPSTTAQLNGDVGYRTLYMYESGADPANNYFAWSSLFANLWM